MTEEDTINKEINKFRKEAIYYSTQGKRFKFLLETVVGCFGSCPGCAFTKDERLNFRSPMMKAEDLPKLFEKMLYLIEYRTGHHGAAIAGPIETTVINFGAGEHFIYDDDYLGKLFEETAKFFSKVPTKRNVLAFSSSGLMNTNKMYERSRTMLSHLKKEQFVVDFVIDLSRFDKLKDRYQKSFDFFIENFGFVDLAINIEKDSNVRDWEALCKFVDERGILNVDLVYALNGNNQHRVAIEAEKFFNVYERIVKNTNNGISLFDINGFLRIKHNESEFLKEVENLEFLDIIKQSASNILKDAIFIDSDFNASPVLFGIFADIPLNERFNWSPVGNIFDEKFPTLWKQYSHKLTQKIMKISANSPQCVDCEFSKQCYMSGAPILNQFLNTWDGKKVESFTQCQNPMKPFWQAKKNNYLIPMEDQC